MWKLVVLFLFVCLFYKKQIPEENAAKLFWGDQDQEMLCGWQNFVRLLVSMGK